MNSLSLFDHFQVEKSQIETLLRQLDGKFDECELYLESTETESFVWDDGKIKSANFDASHGFGLRGVVGDALGYAHHSVFSIPTLKQAIGTIESVRSGYQGSVNLSLPNTAKRDLYRPLNPIDLIPSAAKVKLLEEINAYARRDPNVYQVSASLLGNWKNISILRPDGFCMEDIRPLIRLNVSVYVEKNGKREMGSMGAGGRVPYDHYMKPEVWQHMVDEATRGAYVNLDAIPAPAGEMTVILGPGWPGILLHEAIGHGLEGDFNRKKTSAFSELLGKQIAAKGVTVVDDGTLADRRGSLNVDDEGIPTNCTTLIEDGVLTGFIQDRMNARLMGVKPTGNGRRESYACAPMPRMTNTYMLNGSHSPDEMINSVKNGIYAVNFGGGQVDITSGKFVFAGSEVYKIENGKIGPALKGATLIGNGPDALTKITMVGNDMRLDEGIGTCGKRGQSVPVGVGQPTLKLEGLTVGGTSL